MKMLLELFLAAYVAVFYTEVSLYWLDWKRRAAKSSHFTWVGRLNLRDSKTS